ncbi:transcriptional regulator of RNA polII, SAGA, subunit-domain-containing protein [Suillus paluster]|uniref:transcriptional regulator of RNA polII, SAGA, subunit-domain-containing protein n=1 Tax=Suillus paluster TaxID=48578 RepID=UPI001B884B64|nr:transcriptional regulator of RNA polII, SAGA, subunit-domain-containing protein [Suillus paluster]KAG1746671.1 transcriptional regulator of RNA polII, SAGA, subunit-domain-containing protein [Suillus paluster]
MSLSSTSTIKSQLNAALGQKASAYFETLSQFVSGKISRIEFDESVRQALDAPNLVQLHNSLIISLFDFTVHRRPPTPPPDVSKPPPRKRRRTLPYQGPDDRDDTLRSSRLKRWTVSLGRRERERIRTLQSMPTERPRPRKETDEIVRDRGVMLLTERGDPPGSRLPLHLASVSRAPTLQHISDRINLTAAQHNLGAPSRAVASLLMLAFEAKLKQLITHALSLTSTSHAIASINPSARHSHSRVLTASSFDTLFTLSPAVLPNKSAAAMRLAIGDNDIIDDEDVALLKDREVRDQRWQILALLAERSTVNEALRNLR